jgi:hypothetical protein
MVQGVGLRQTTTTTYCLKKSLTMNLTMNLMRKMSWGQGGSSIVGRWGLQGG